MSRRKLSRLQRAMLIAATGSGVCALAATGGAQSPPPPEVPVLAGPGHNSVLRGPSGWVAFSAIINQNPPSGGSPRQYADRVEVCVSRPGVACGTRDSEVCEQPTPLGKQGVRYQAIKPLQVPYEFNNRTVHWTMRACKGGLCSAWALPIALTYQYTARPSPPPPRCAAPAPPPAPPVENEPYEFGWETAVTQREMDDFELPDQCVVGKNLEQIVHARRSPDCSVRQDGGLCAQCHRQNAASPTLEGIGKALFCDEVPDFVQNLRAAPDNYGSAKPDNLKDFFEDWYDRGCPD